MNVVYILRFRTSERSLIKNPSFKESTLDISNVKENTCSTQRQISDNKKIPSFWESTLDYFERKGKHLYLMWSRDIVRVDITERGCGSAGICVLQVGRVGITGQYSLNLMCMC